jgi:hypothetical protein
VTLSTCSFSCLVCLRAVAEAKEVDSSKGANGSKGKQFQIPMKNKELSLSKLVNDASDNDPDFWNYRSDKNNCQVFTDKLITRSGLAPDDPVIAKELEPQNGVALIDAIPKPLRGIPNFITDIAGVADRVIHGDGIRYRRRRYR